MFDEVKRLNGKRALKLAISSCIAIGILIGVLFLTTKRVQNSRFCAKCHTGESFNNACGKSLPEGVACIECHAHRNNNAIMATEIRDKNCTRDSCHSIEKLNEKSVQFQSLTEFKHKTHREAFPSNLKLRCTSCHSFLGGEKHFETDVKTCYTCHFMNTQQPLPTEKNKPVSACSLCHRNIEKTLQIYNKVFDHTVYEEKVNVSCSDCHFAFIQGQGEVDKKNCYVCHQTVNNHFNKATEMHDIHITKHSTSCTPCHNTIEHTQNKGSDSVLSNMQTLSFDTSRYKTQRMIMAGTGGMGIDDEPDPMYLATLNCSACHKDKFLSKVDPKVCNNCHKNGFDRILYEQMHFVKKKMQELKSLRKKMRRHSHNKENKSVKEAETNYHLIKEDGSLGVHNIKYTKDLLEYSISNLKQLPQ